MRERARAAPWWLGNARGSSLLKLLATRPGRSGYHRTTISQDGGAGCTIPGGADVDVGPNSVCEPTGTAALPGGHDQSIMVRTFLPPTAGRASVGGGVWQ